MFKGKEIVFNVQNLTEIGVILLRVNKEIK
jgi:hypothetical protein